MASLLGQLYRERFFPINVSNTRADALVIEDRRPSSGLVISVVLLAGAVLASALVFRPAIANGIYWLLALCLLPIPILAWKSLRLPWREQYVFDKAQNAYTFIRRGISKAETTEGDLREIRAVQIERRRVTTEHGTEEIFRAVLLRRQGLLLGASDVVPLRESSPIGASYESEAQLASAIANFLNLPGPETVDAPN
jgi:hypothetical protein